MKRGSYLHGSQKAMGSVDDAFFIAEDWYKKVGEGVGVTFLGMTKKQADRKNKLMKTVRELASKGHFTHSPLQRNIRFLSHFSNVRPVIDTPIKRLRKIINR